MSVGPGSLSTRQSPPLAVPMRFFLTAPLFWLAAGGLLLIRPEALADRWSPEMLALTHLWVLGFMLMVMAGAIQQVIPVLVGVVIPRPQLVSRVLHLLLGAGAVTLVSALWLQRPAWFPLAGGLLGGAVVWLLGATAAALYRSPSVHATAGGMQLALLALAVTVGLGLWLALGHAGWLPLRRDWTDVHLTWGLIGWTVLLVAAVAWQVVPMFQVTPRYPVWLMRGFGPLVFLSLLLWVGGRWMAPFQWVGAVGLSFSLLALAGWTLWLQSRRRRRVADATLDFWRLAMASLMAAVATWWLRRAGMALPEALPGVLLAVGFAGSAIVGMLYKIVPFLIWLHLTNRAMAGAGLELAAIPNMKQVIPAARSRLLFRLYLLWWSLLLAALFVPRLSPAVGLGTLLVAALLEFHLLATVRLYQRLQAS